MTEGRSETEVDQLVRIMWSGQAAPGGLICVNRQWRSDDRCAHALGGHGSRRRAGPSEKVSGSVSSLPVDTNGGRNCAIGRPGPLARRPAPCLPGRGFNPPVDRMRQQRASAIRHSRSSTTRNASVSLRGQVASAMLNLCTAATAGSLALGLLRFASSHLGRRRIGRPSRRRRILRSPTWRIAPPTGSSRSCERAAGRSTRNRRRMHLGCSRMPRGSVPATTLRREGSPSVASVLGSRRCGSS